MEKHIIHMLIIAVNLLATMPSYSMENKDKVLAADPLTYIAIEPTEENNYLYKEAITRDEFLVARYFDSKQNEHGLKTITYNIDGTKNNSSFDLNSAHNQKKIIKIIYNEPVLGQRTIYYDSNQKENGLQSQIINPIGTVMSETYDPTSPLNTDKKTKIIYNEPSTGFRTIYYDSNNTPEGLESEIINYNKKVTQRDYDPNSPNNLFKKIKILYNNPEQGKNTIYYDSKQQPEGITKSIVDARTGMLLERDYDLDSLLNPKKKIRIMYDHPEDKYIVLYDSLKNSEGLKKTVHCYSKGTYIRSFYDPKSENNRDKITEIIFNNPTRGKCTILYDRTSPKGIKSEIVDSTSLNTSAKKSPEKRRHDDDDDDVKRSKVDLMNVF